MSLQTEYIGVGEIARLAQIIKENKAQRIFLVTGKTSYTTSGACTSIEEMRGDLSWFHFNKFGELPLYEDILRGLTAFKEYNPDMVVAIGGGSVIDVAKTINILAAQEGSGELYVEGKKPVEASGKSLVAIPTTCGSGSEATRFAVVYKGGRKYSLESEYILPNYAIVDPALCLSLPKSQRIASGLDALTQSIESYWSTKATKETRKDSQAALTLVRRYIVDAVESPDKEAIEEMCKAAHMAGRAINISKTTACHALSYGLTYHFKVPHGVAVASLLPAVYAYNSEDESLSEVFSDLNRTLGFKSTPETIEWFKDLLTRFGIMTLGRYGAQENDIESLVKEVNTQRLATNPRPVPPHVVRDIYKSIL